jgi:hypothetical protein
VVAVFSDPVMLVAVVGAIRLCERVISGWVSGWRDLVRGRILVALVEVAGPSSTVLGRHGDGAFVMICRPGVTR